MDKSLILTEEGSHTIHSQQFEATYHSTHGAIQETRTVFIEAGFQHFLNTGMETINILEIGFGTGLNALMTLLAFQNEKVNVNYVTYEAYPIGVELAKKLNYTSLLEAPQFQEDFIKMHQMQEDSVSFENDLNASFKFQLNIMKFEEIAAQESFNLIYFDAFAPSTQAHLWENPFLEKMYQALLPEGLLVTYCAQGAFKRALKAAGFSVKGLPGPIGKREMTVGKK